MRIVRTVAQLREELGRSHGIVGLVPTMGALHEGHLSLVRAARADCDTVVMSLFVNPTQFTDAEDLTMYPRDEDRDARLAADAGVDLMFAPEVAEVYPDGFSTLVRVTGTVAERFEAEARGPEHFDGVATVVAKLLLAVEPERAYFGQKDAQQLAVVRRMVRDLGIETDIVACPTSREPDGLPRSSRNARLDPSARALAATVSASLFSVKAALDAGETTRPDASDQVRRLLADHGIRPDYVACVDADTFEPCPAHDGRSNRALLIVAAPVGGVRILDNVPLEA